MQRIPTERYLVTADKEGRHTQWVKLDTDNSATLQSDGYAWGIVTLRGTAMCVTKIPDMGDMLCAGNTVRVTL